ncbi:MAG: 5-(carboxyamino)imidazole ribonucleotide mutase [Candidatus Omnitrophica bacterium]|nr:5-(carboxyamino)imidazole ribonucleotide mutase [Candidatus Omnitrophota bacterium]
MGAKNKPAVAIIMGSDSDLPVMQNSADTLKEFGVSFEIMVLSAHRTPELTMEYAHNAIRKGIKVIIAGAGGAAHLAGVIASHTTLPVIGVPMESKLNGLDSLLSTVQMPSGVPVATVAIGKAGAVNAAILAVQMMALGDNDLAAKLVDHKKDLVKKVWEKNKQGQ